MNVKPACEARSLNLSGGTEPAGPCPVLVRWSVDAESARRCNSIKAKAKRRHTAVRFLIVIIDLRQSSRRGVRTVREYQYGSWIAETEGRHPQKKTILSIENSLDMEM